MGVSLDSLADIAEARGAFAALPPESPLGMPAQDLRRATPPSPRPPSSPAMMAGRRLLVLGGAIVLTMAAAREMHLVLGAAGFSWVEVPILTLFVMLFAWIALALVSAVCGFVVMLSGGGRRLDPAGSPRPLLGVRTALLMPTYNESPARVAAALEVIHRDLRRLGAGADFDLFILSDTTDPDVWIAEEAAFLSLRARTGDDDSIFYRRRPVNTERKAGNIGDWVRRFGGAYPQMMILDADSVMTGDCIIRLAGAMERHPDIGLIQTLPVIVGGQTPFARMQQFAGRVYGPMIAQGLAWWHGSEGNYWGHNAMIRTRAFAEHAGLPSLSGRKPFGGHIMSHDFVEAALLRRAGWAVHMMPALEGSYEESPPSLTDVAVRDRRWCQGNLQHIAVLPTRGLHWVSRLHLLMGIGSYITAPLWLMFLLGGVLVTLRSHFVLPDYFPSGPSLFPQWPSVDPVRSMWVFIGTMGLLIGPKLLAWLVLLVRPAERRGTGGAILSLLSVVMETLLAGLLAPVSMLTQSSAVLSILAGRDSGWQSQRRDDGSIPFGEVCRRYWAHTVFGLALGLVSYLVSTSLLLWMSPVILGLTLSIPLAAVTASARLGRALQRIGLLRTPEETSPPAVITESRRIQAESGGEDLEGFARLFADDALLAAHRAMLPPERVPGRDPIDVPLLLGLARLEEAATLPAALAHMTSREKAAVLASRRGLALAAALTR
jgi:membrane glycosyltransferase